MVNKYVLIKAIEYEKSPNCFGFFRSNVRGAKLLPFSDTAIVLFSPLGNTKKSMDESLSMP